MNERETRKEKPDYQIAEPNHEETAIPPCKADEVEKPQLAEIETSTEISKEELEIKGIYPGDKCIISHESPNCPMCGSEKMPKYCPKCGNFLRGVSETLLEEEEGKMPVIDRFWCSNDECDFEMEIEGEERLQEAP